MRFGTINYNGKPTAIMQGEDNKARLMADICKKSGIPPIHSILELIELEDKDILNQLSLSVSSVEPIEDSLLDWLPPVTKPSKILGVAFNNKELMKQAHFDPGVPNYFLKPPSALQGNGKPIRIDPS
jgi:2-keto-4-pentenoate hydratase/2-oxohepta-3-ene-1,7-dioic acid hydratase in catechol pathway